MAIEGGRFQLIPASGKPVPTDWMETHQESLIEAILQRSGMSGFTFDGHSTGHYGVHNAPGITLQFTNIVTLQSAYSIFNAELSRKLNTKFGKAGDPLPEGHFRVGKRSNFWKFWRGTALPMPKRISSFHDYMGNLRDLIFDCRPDSSNRIQNDQINLLMITQQQILSAFSPNGCRTVAGQLSDKPRTRLPDKESQQRQARQPFQPIQTTGDSKYGISKQGSAGKGMFISSSCDSIAPQEQTTEEWLADLDSEI